MGTRPTIVRNPPNDPDFERAIDALLDDGVDDPPAAEEMLRAQYPHVVVRPRELAAETTAVWYVYRDGRWTAGD